MECSMYTQPRCRSLLKDVCSQKRKNTQPHQGCLFLDEGKHTTTPDVSDKLCQNAFKDVCCLHECYKSILSHAPLVHVYDVHVYE